MLKPSMRVRHWTVLWALLMMFPGIVFTNAWSRVVHDRDGRVVDLGRAPPRRVVAMVPSLAEIMVWMGARRRLVGVTRYTRSIPGLLGIPRVGSPLTPDLEAIESLNPDLVLLLHGQNQKSLADALDRLAVRYLVFRESTLSDMETNLRLLGDIFQAGPKVSTWLRKWHRMGRCLKAIRWTNRPRVLFLVSVRPIMAPGHGSFIEDILDRSGLASITGDFDLPWPRIAFEEVYGRRPEVLLLPRAIEQEARSVFQRDPAWMTLEAVSNRRIYIVPDNVLRSTPGLAKIIENLVTHFHPNNREAKTCFQPSS